MGLSWAKLNFVENPGMAFGWKFGGDYGKLALSLFRLVAIGFLGYYIIKLIKKDVNLGLLVSFSLILAGAIGNILDSAFYGMIFTESNFHCVNGPAKMFAPEGGYAGFLHGKVVDMLFFPLWKNANGEVLFFQPVFNIADSAITMGVISILLFQRNYFNGKDDAENKAQIADNQSITSENEISDVSFQEEFDAKNALASDNIASEQKNTEGVVEEIEKTIKDEKDSPDNPI